MARNPTATLGERLTRIGLIVLTGAVLLFLVAPILTIVPLSFSSGSFLYYPLPGLSLRWYQDFFTSSFWLSSLRNSLIIGVSATGQGKSTFLRKRSGTVANTSASITDGGAKKLTIPSLCCARNPFYVASAVPTIFGYPDPLNWGRFPAPHTRPTWRNKLERH